MNFIFRAIIIKILLNYLFVELNFEKIILLLVVNKGLLFWPPPYIIDYLLSSAKKVHNPALSYLQGKLNAFKLHFETV